MTGPERPAAGPSEPGVPDDYDRALVQRAAQVVAAPRANDPEPPDLPVIPAPRMQGKRTLVCPHPGCNHRFQKPARYDLHWRIQHGNPAKSGEGGLR